MHITWVYTGYNWDPSDKSVAGSEQAVVHLSEHLVKRGAVVTVYAFVPPQDLNGVSYKWLDTFDCDSTYDVLILCREGILQALKERRPKARIVLSDLHDDVCSDETPKFVSYVTRFMFKSNYHLSRFSHLSLSEDKYFICPNGLQLQNFTPTTEQRDPLRFCYTSSYDRGLEQLLEWSWPKIHKEFPTSTLHVYYGWAPWHETGQRNRIEKLMEQSGVIHHGRVSNAEVISEKYKSSMHLYPCHHPTEIDCINIRESVLAECIPVLSDQNVCPERDGVHVAGNPKEKSFHDVYAQTVIDLIRDPDRQVELRKKFSCSCFLFGWDYVADKWLSVITRSP
jgi:glycosyltransferase involved in cell wall biosynthesis